MSHNYPHRRQPSDSDLRPDPGSYSSSGRRRASPDHDFYRPPQESFSSSYRASSRAQWAQDGAVLSSCGLEPSDLALLAELPEDVLTVESLPQVLKQLKGKRGTVKSFPPNAPSSSSAYSHSSAHRPAVSPSTRNWDQPGSQLLQYPGGQVKPSPLLPDLDRWGNPRTCRSSRTGPPSSSSSYVVDYNHGPGSSEHGKTGRDASPGSSQHRTSFSSAAGGKRTRPSQLGSADYRSAPPLEYRRKTREGRHESDTSFIKSSSQLSASTPSKKEALDFHGTTPPVYPHSCSLCDITVMSERVSTPVLLLCGRHV